MICRKHFKTQNGIPLSRLLIDGLLSAGILADGMGEGKGLFTCQLANLKGTGTDETGRVINIKHTYEEKSKCESF